MNILPFPVIKIIYFNGRIEFTGNEEFEKEVIFLEERPDPDR